MARTCEHIVTKKKRLYRRMKGMYGISVITKPHTHKSAYNIFNRYYAKWKLKGRLILTQYYYIQHTHRQIHTYSVICTT